MSVKDARLAALLEKFSRDAALYFSARFDVPLADPLWVFISLSHECTYRCQMCGVVHVLKGHTLDPEVVRRVLTGLSRGAHRPTVVFTGGETFLRPEVFPLIEHAASLGLSTEAVSNGSLFDESLARRVISSGLTNIAISLDGATAETHDHIRQPGAFEQALRALSLLRDEKRRRGKGPQISVWTTIMKENVRELVSIVPLAKDHGAECLVFHPVIAAQDDMQHTSADAPFWVRGKLLQELSRQIDELVAYQKRHGFIAFLHDPYLWLRYFDGTLSPAQWRCNPFVFLNIGPDAQVRSCGASFGSVSSLSLEECLRTPEADRARKAMKRCATPCLQTCWANPDSDSLEKAVEVFVEGVGRSGAAGPEKKAALVEAQRILARYERYCEEKKR